MNEEQIKEEATVEAATKSLNASCKRRAGRTSGQICQTSHSGINGCRTYSPAGC